jgi:hypothetical protein
MINGLQIVRNLRQTDLAKREQGRLTHAMCETKELVGTIPHALFTGVLRLGFRPAK